MRATAFRILAAICALHVSGVLWVALQTAAWTGMLVTRSQQTTVSEAVRTTFDGEHPCSMCEALAKAKEVEQQQEKDTVLADALAKLSFVSPARIQVPAPTLAGITFVENARLACPRKSAPPSPPPRGA